MLLGVRKVRDLCVVYLRKTGYQCIVLFVADERPIVWCEEDKKPVCCLV